MAFKMLKLLKALREVRANNRVLKGAYNCIQNQLYCIQADFEELRARVELLEVPVEYDVDQMVLEDEQ